MTAWTLIQILIDLVLALGLFLLAMRFARSSKEDPRLSRGLQVLQSKISVLEDLSDRSEAQVGELSELLDQKSREALARSAAVEAQIHRMQGAMDKSLEVVRLFQDRVPHQEIIERQNAVKYVKAARLAHQGLTAIEIARQVDLPMGEIEFISKINRDGLVFDEAQLPAWIREGLEHPESLAAARSLASFIPSAGSASSAAVAQPQGVVGEDSVPAEKRGLIESLHRLRGDMQQLGEELAQRSSRDQKGLPAMAAAPAPLTSSPSELPAELPSDEKNTPAVQTSREFARKMAGPQIRKVQFPRIEKPV